MNIGWLVKDSGVTWDDCEMTWDHLIDFEMVSVHMTLGWLLIDFGLALGWIMCLLWHDFLVDFKWFWVCEKEHVRKSNRTRFIYSYF